MELTQTTLYAMYLSLRHRTKCMLVCRCHWRSLSLFPLDSSVRRQYAVLQDKLKEHWEKEKQKYQGLFSSQSDRNPPAAGESNTN